MAPPRSPQTDWDSEKQTKRSSNKSTCWKHDNCISDGWPFFFTVAIKMIRCMHCVRVFVCVSQVLKGVMIGSSALCFWGGDGCSVFIHSYSYISMFLTWVGALRNEWMCVCELVCTASLNTQSFHKTDPSRAVGGPNIDLLKWANESVISKFMVCKSMWVCVCACAV